MADRKPLKVLPDGGGDSTGLGEFVAADTIGVVDGGTGLATVATSNILTGNGTSALSAESNLTFDGTVLTVTGTELVNSGSTKVIAEFTSSNTNRMIVVSADTETANDTAGIAFNATASQAVGSTHSIAAIEGKVTQAGTLKGDLIFHINAGDSYTERMRIHSDGLLRVIGTAASPSSANGAAGVAYFTGAASDSGIAVGSYASSPWDNWIQSQQENGTVSDLVMQPRGGNVGIGTTDPGFALHVVGSASGDWSTRVQNSNSSNPFGLQIYYSAADPDDNTAEFFRCQGNAGVIRMRIYSDGDVVTHDAGTLTSDERLKTNIVDASDKLADVMKLQVRNYEWTPEFHPNKVGEKKIGFIAQELETVFPNLVSDHDIATDNSIEEELYDANDDTQYYVDGDDIPDGKQVGDVKAESQIPDGKQIGDVKVEAKDHEPTIRKAYKDAFAPILVKALQEVTVRLEAAEAKIAALESA